MNLEKQVAISKKEKAEVILISRIVLCLMC